MLPFQKGAFLIAQQANVRIVPLSLSHTGEVMPVDALFPLRPGLGYTRIHIHPPVTTAGRDIKEIMAEVMFNVMYAGHCLYTIKTLTMVQFDNFLYN